MTRCPRRSSRWLQALATATLVTAVVGAPQTLAQGETGAADAATVETEAAETAATETNAAETAATETNAAETAATETNAAETAAETAATETNAAETAATETNETETAAETAATDTNETETAAETAAVESAGDESLAEGAVAIESAEDAEEADEIAANDDAEAADATDAAAPVADEPPFGLSGPGLTAGIITGVGAALGLAALGFAGGSLALEGQIPTSPAVGEDPAAFFAAQSEAKVPLRAMQTAAVGLAFLSVSALAGGGTALAFSLGGE